MRAGEVAEGELFAADPTWRFAVAGADEVLTGTVDDPAELVAAVGDRAVVAYDAKALGVVPPNLVHDALIGAYILEPARRGYPLRELLEERGLASSLEDEVAAEAVLVRELSAWQREQIVARDLTVVMQEIELPLVPVLRAMEVAGVRLNTARMKEITTRVRDEVHDLELKIWALAGTEFVIGSPQQLGEILFNKLGLSKKRRGKTGFSTDARVLQAIRGEHEIIPLIERWRELNQLDKTYFSRAAAARRARPASRASTRRSCRPPRRPAGSPRRTRTCRTSRSARTSAARCAAASRRRPATSC